MDKRFELPEQTYAPSGKWSSTTTVAIVKQSGSEVEFAGCPTKTGGGDYKQRFSFTVSYRYLIYFQLYLNYFVVPLACVLSAELENSEKPFVMCIILSLIFRDRKLLPTSAFIDMVDMLNFAVTVF
ncbi:unnamed protein product [Nesidiocoris tenuis]|uniref:Uncharacterized protein n=1 Tax=Nesidiocoris tenuis TaxID=355587 RepID=A0A6H5G1Y2_9HEMI|nr:unnamed protein product [Nesidiocoris tenuis]